MFIPGIRDLMPGCQIPDPGSQIPDPGSQTPDPRSQIPDPGSQRIPDPGSQIPDPRFPDRLQFVVLFFMSPLQITRERLLQKGLQERLQEGLQKGRQEEKQSVILKMLKNNMDISTIAKITESTENKIREIQKKLNNLN